MLFVVKKCSSYSPYFPARTSQNIVLLATTARVSVDLHALRPRAALMFQGGRISLPGFLTELERFQTQPPANVLACPILTDDYAPVEGLSEGGGAGKRE